MILIDGHSNKKIHIKPEFSVDASDFKLSVIKEKILINYNREYLDKETITISDGEKYIIKDLKVLNLDKIIVYNLIDELTPHITENLYDYFNDPDVSKLYNSLVKIYSELSLDKLELVVRYILSQNIPFIKDDDYSLDTWMQDSKIKIEEYKLKYLTKKHSFKMISLDSSGDVDYSIISAIMSVKYNQIIDNDKLIKEFPLDEEIPFMFSKNQETKEPIIKIYKNTPKSLSDQWLKTKKSAGIVCKLQYKTKGNKKKYITANISHNKKVISIRIGWDFIEKVKFSEIELIKNKIEKFIEKINKVLNIKLSIDQYKVSLVNCLFSSVEKLDIDQIKIALNQTLDTFKNKFSKYKTGVEFTHVSTSKNLIVRNTDASTNVIVFNLQTEDELFSIFKDLDNLLIIAKNVTPMLLKDGKLVKKNIVKNSPKIKLEKNLDLIKKMGLNINSKSCQKIRQPIVVSGKVVCSNPDFPYLGKTQDNSICCFKKESSDKQKNIPDRILKSDKLLKPDRLGLLPERYYDELFNKGFYRLGIDHGENSILNALRVCTDKNIDIKVFPDKLNVKFYENIFKVNILIFTGNDYLLCREFLDLKYKSFVILKQYQEEDKYEVIIYKKSQKQFTREEQIIKKILNLYNKSCIVKFIGFEEVPLDIITLDEKIKVLGQIINDFGNSIFAVTKHGLIPVIPFNYASKFSVVNLSKNKLNAKLQYELLEKSKLSYATPVGQVTNKDAQTIGILTKCGLIVPVIPSKKLQSIPTVFEEYIENIDTILLKNDYPVYDKRMNYIIKYNFYTELYQRFRYTFSKLLQDNKIEIKKLRKSENISRELKETMDKEVTLLTKLKPSTFSERNVCSKLSTAKCNTDIFCKSKNNECKFSLTRKIYNDFLSKLVTEIKNTPKNLLNVINSSKLDKNLFIKRDSEVLLLSDADIKNFMKT